MPRAGVGACSLPSHVVPGAEPARRLRRRPVRVHVVPRASVRAASLTGLVLPGANGTRRRRRCPGPGVVPRWGVQAVRGGGG